MSSEEYDSQEEAEKSFQDEEEHDEEEEQESEEREEEEEEEEEGNNSISEKSEEKTTSSLGSINKNRQIPKLRFSVASEPELQLINEVKLNFVPEKTTNHDDSSTMFSKTRNAKTALKILKEINSNLDGLELDLTKSFKKYSDTNRYSFKESKHKREMDYSPKNMKYEPRHEADFFYNSGSDEDKRPTRFYSEKETNTYTTGNNHRNQQNIYTQTPYLETKSEGTDPYKNTSSNYNYQINNKPPIKKQMDNNFNNQIRTVEDLYRNSGKNQPIIYGNKNSLYNSGQKFYEPEPLYNNKNNQYNQTTQSNPYNHNNGKIVNKNLDNYNNNSRNNNFSGGNEKQRYKPKNIDQAIDILLRNDD